MKLLVNILCAAVVLTLLVMPTSAVAAPGDTLTVYATTGASFDAVIKADTVAGGAQKHLVYKLPSLDTTYYYLGTITLKSSVTFLGVLGGNGRPPCILPGVLGDNSTPSTLFTLTGQGTKVTLRNLYLLAAATNNTINGAGIAVQISADSVSFVSNNVVYDGWQTFAIGYNGNYDKFLITNCKFRNMVHPNQWYIGEVLRNEWPGAAYTDSVIFRYNTMLCINGYASGTVTKYYQKYFEFTHNTVVYTFKNPFFEFNITNGKFNDNIFYGLHAGGVSASTEYPWWDQLWSPAISSVIDIDTLDLAKDSVFNPTDKANANHRMLSEAKRSLQVRNNAYFWPAALTSFWTSWNDTAHVDSIYTTSWMNARTQAFFTHPSVWPNMTQSGNVSADPGFGAGVGNVLTNAGGGNGIGLLPWFVEIRRGTASTDLWGYKPTQVGAAINWVPAWPLPEATDMMYSNTALKTGSTDGIYLGDPNWFGVTLDVKSDPGSLPLSFTLTQNYPNPFNPATKIQFSLPSLEQVSLKVFNVLGQEVATLVNGPVTAGSHEVSFDASHLASGVYMYKLVAGSFVSTRKMLLLK